jgi:uncharacterized protein YjbJ (UPF0337 family)
MNKDTAEGKWRQLTGKVKTQWGKLTDDDLDVVAGNYETLLGKVQERYGIERDEAQRQIDEFKRRNAG